MRHCISLLCWLAFVVVLILIITLWTARPASADPGVIPLYHYGTEEDGNLGQPTAFAESWRKPAWLWSTVRQDKPGVALHGYAPGTWVRLTVVELPAWAYTWPNLPDLIGNSITAVVAGRPGERWYGDAWKLTFEQLAPLEVGKLYVEVHVITETMVIENSVYGIGPSHPGLAKCQSEQRYGLSSEYYTGRCLKHRVW